MREYTIDIDFKRDLKKVIKSKAYFHVNDRNTSKFICNLLMEGKRINLRNCIVSSDIMLYEDNYENAPCLQTNIVDASNGVIEFVLSEEFMISGTKMFQLHINNGVQVLHSPMVEFNIFKGL